MTGLVFVDTNVFVYRHDGSAPAKQPKQILNESSNFDAEHS